MAFEHHDGRREKAAQLWATIGNIGGGGVMGAIAGDLMQRLSPTIAALGEMAAPSGPVIT